MKSGVIVNHHQKRKIKENIIATLFDIYTQQRGHVINCFRLHGFILNCFCRAKCPISRLVREKH